MINLLLLLLSPLPLPLLLLLPLLPYNSGALLQERREWVDPPGNEIAVYDNAAAEQRAALRRDKAEVDYYALLQVRGWGGGR